MTMLARLRSSVAGLARSRRRPVRPGRLLFVFGGASHNWRGPGSELYRGEPVFREAVDAADVKVRATLGFSPSAMFRGQWQPGSDEEERRADIVSMGLLHLGLADLWAAAGIRPDGVLGLSLGEMGSAYAAGAISRETAVAIFCTIARRLGIQSDDHVLLIVEARPEAIGRLCESSPAPLHLAGEPFPGAHALLTRSPHIEAVRAHLEGRAGIVAEHDTKWPYHVPGVVFDAPGARADLSGMRWSAPRMPVYLASVGGRVPDAHGFGPEHWASMPTGPYRLAGASVAALTEGYDLLVNVGAASIGLWVTGAAPAGADVRLVDATPAGGGVESWKQALALVGSLTGRTARPDEPVPVPDLEAPGALADPHAAYERLRRGGSVHYLPRQKCWIALGYGEVKEALADTGRLSNAPYGPVGPVLMADDPPAHRPIRRLVAPLFAPAAVAELTRKVGEQGHLVRPEFDLVAAFARPLAQSVAADLLHFPPDIRPALAAAGDSYRAKGRRLADYRARLESLAPRSGAFARLVEDGGGTVGEVEGRQLIAFLWLAATETTERAIVHGVLRLLEDRAPLDAVRDDRRRLQPFVEEVLRLHPPELMVPRLTLASVTLGGVSIPKGERVMLCLAAANRDPGRFADAERLSLDRPASDHLSFGTGIHRCSGTALARSVVPAALALVLDGAPDLRPAEPLESVRYFTSLTVRTPERLRVASGL
ncbi:MAG TPA: cytochrome P450 [Allosphingosinicella sp.]|jgi:hypothetical protein